MPLQISEGQDEAEIKAEVEALLPLGWALKEESKLEKTYNFKTYTKVADLHHIIATRSKSANHHSIMTTTAGTLTVLWTTHKPPGLSKLDTLMAKYCDERANEIGTVKPSEAHRCGPAPAQSTG